MGKDNYLEEEAAAPNRHPTSSTSILFRLFYPKPIHFPLSSNNIETIMDLEIGQAFHEATSEYDEFQYQFEECSFHITGFRDNQHTLHAEGKLVWPSSELLAEYISRNKDIFQNKTILEIGAGQAKLCKAKVILTDYDEAALSLLQSNVIKNFKDDARPLCCTLTWGDDDSMANLQAKVGVQAFEIIIGSDILYYRDSVKSLVKTIHTLLAEHGLFVLYNQVVRMAPHEDAFYQALEEFGLEKKVFTLHPISHLFHIWKKNK